MPIHKTILPDGTLGYKWGTTGKAYRRKQDAERQERAIYASGWREPKDQHISTKCPECGKKECICEKVRNNKTQEKKAMSNKNNIAPMTLLDAQRLSMMQQQMNQRRIAHMKKLYGDDAATAKTRLSGARALALLASTVAGAGIGAVVGGIHGGTKELTDHDKKYKITKADNAQGGVAAGLMLGGGIGLLAGLLGTGVGSIAGNWSSVDKDKLKNRIQNMTLADYVVPGRASYLDAQLYKDFLENEDTQNRPQQLVF